MSVTLGLACLMPGKWGKGKATPSDGIIVYSYIAGSLLSVFCAMYEDYHHQRGIIVIHGCAMNC